jgi:predicted nucleotidyltransferase
MDTNIKQIKKKIIPILKQHKVKRAGLFGSCVKGKMKKNSDIDILVEIDDRISLLDFVRIQHELEDVLEKKVDLGEYETIKPAVRDRILAEEVRIL